MTVSRALSGNQSVREATRKAVLTRARELGYVKSAAATAIRGDRTTIVGLLLPNLVNEFYARFSNKLAEHCENKGLQLVIHLTGDDIKKEYQSVLRLLEIQARAVVMVPTPGFLEDEEKYLEELQLIQLIRTRTVTIPSAAVLVDDAAAISKAVQHLSTKGHSRIGYVGGETTLSSGRERFSAFMSGMQRAGLDTEPDDILTDMPTFSMGHRAAQSLIDAGNVTAMICGGFEISNGALNGCLEKGLRLPTDISFIGFGDPSFYRWISGGISTIRIPVDSLAAKTAMLLDPANRSKTAPPIQQILPAELVIRNS